MIALDGFTFTLEELQPDRLTRWHGHEAARLCAIVRSGVGEDRGSRHEEFGPGDVLFRPADVEHRNRYGSPRPRIVRVEIDPAREGALVTGSRSRAHLSEPRSLRSEDSQRTVRRILAELLDPDDASAVALESLALELVGELLRTRAGSEPAPRWLDRVAERVREEFASPLSLGTLARDAGVHPTHLSRSFRQRYGLTVGEAVLRARIEEARRSLERTERSIADIAQELGFCDQSHFSHRFRRETGLSPARYRRRARVRL